MTENLNTVPSTLRNGRRKPARPRPLPPDVNARNLAIEKQRREDMNEKFSVRPVIPWLHLIPRAA